MTPLCVYHAASHSEPAESMLVASQGYHTRVSYEGIGSSDDRLWKLLHDSVQSSACFLPACTAIAVPWGK
jgi:hypothetical protein